MLWHIHTNYLLIKNNKSGYSGVYNHKRTINGKEYSYWVVTLGRKYVDQFKTKKEAIKKRKEIENENKIV